MSCILDSVLKFRKELEQLIQAKEYSNILISIDDLISEVSGNDSKNLNNLEYYRKIFENSLSGFGVTNLKGEVIDANHALLKMLGFDSLKSFKKHNIREFYGNLSEREKLITELENTGFVKEFKFKIKTIDNRNITARINANMLKNGNDEPIVIVNFEDISEQQKYHEDLIESENYLDLIFNSVNSGVLLIDPESHRIIDVNNYALNFFMREKDDVIEKECFDLVCESSRGRCPITDLKKSVNDSICEIAVQGDIHKFILKNVKKVKIKEKEFLLETFIDIQEQKRIEKELKVLNEELEHRVQNRTQKLAESEDKFRTLFESSRDAIVLVTTKGFFDCNRAALDIYGYKSKKEFLKLHPADLSPPFQPNGENSFNLANKYIKEAMDKKIPMFEWVHKRKNGTAIYCEVFLSPIKINNKKAAHALIRDVSGRKKVEETIRKSEEKFRKLSELSPSAISIQRGNQYFYVNQAWSEITGYRQEDIYNVGPFDIIHPELRDVVKKLSDENLKNEGAKIRYDLKIITKDKKIKWLDVLVTTIKYETKNATFAISNDVTDVRKIQQNLKDSENKYRGLIENLKYEYFFYKHNTKGVFEYVSPSVQNVLGFEQEDFLTHYSNHFTDNPINEVAKQKTELAMQGIQQLPYELEIYDIQNNIHTLEISETPIVDSEGNVLAVEGIAHDITSEKKTKQIIQDQLTEIKINNEEIKSTNEELNAMNDDLEARIKEIDILNKELNFSKTKYETLVKNIPGIVFRCRIDKYWTMEYISDEVEVLTGYKASDFILSNTRSFTSIIHEEDRIMVNRVIKESIKGGDSYAVEYRLINLKGNIIWVFERGQLLTKGKKKLLNGVILDISDKKKVEEKLIQSEKELRKLNAQKDKFFSLIAHDLRSPVSNFVQTSELLEMKHEELSKKNLELFFGDLTKLANSTLKLLENLLMWSRNQLGHLEINREQINVFSIVEDIRSLYAANLQMKNQTLENILPEEFNITSDKNIIHSVLRNLIINAIKFTPSGGKVVVKSKKDKSGNQILMVKDNGVGIPTDKIERIFDIDSDFTRQGTHREKGTGLGLVLCRELIEKLGGKIWVESTEGQGTIFYFTLER